MPGISQVWLTEKELEELASAGDVMRKLHPNLITPTMTTAFDKIEMALAPVACRVASS